MCRQRDSKGFSCSVFKHMHYRFSTISYPCDNPAEIKTMLKELALLVTLLTLLADARPQRFEVCDHCRHIIDH